MRPPYQAVFPRSETNDANYGTRTLPLPQPCNHSKAMTPARDPNQQKEDSHLETMEHKSKGQSTNKSIPPIYACRMKNDEVNDGKGAIEQIRKTLTSLSIYLSIYRSMGLFLYVCIYPCIYLRMYLHIYRYRCKYGHRYGYRYKSGYRYTCVQVYNCISHYFYNV